MFDLSEVTYVHRIAVGSRNAEQLQSDEQIEIARALLNRCLEEGRGRIVGIEKSFSILNVGEHSVVLQGLVYHVGFARRPFWLVGG